MGVEARALTLASLLRDVPDFPTPGIIYKDITPLLADPVGFAMTVDGLADLYVGRGIDRVVGVEARGFIIGAPVAYRLGAGFTPVRKAGKLPWSVEAEEYALEYGTDRLEVHVDAVVPGERVLIIDDVLATGGTAAATVRLLERVGAEVVGLGFILELTFLHGRERLTGYEVDTLLVVE